MSKGTGKHFSMAADRGNLIFSGLIFLFVVGLFVGLGVFFTSLQGFPASGMVIHVVVGVIVLGSFLWAGLFAPARLVLTEEHLEIYRNLGAAGPVRFSLREITSVRSQPLSEVIRLVGAGGFLGAWGEMRSAELERFQGYITRSGAYVVLEREGASPLVVTPVDVSAFVKAVEAAIA